MLEEHEEEMERVERIRRMQSLFNRERNKYKRSYESWKENGPGAYHKHFQRDDWYWKADASFRDQRTNYRLPQRDGASYPLSRHYSVLGPERNRIQKMRLRQHSGPRQNDSPRIRTRIIKWPRRNLKR